MQPSRSRQLRVSWNRTKIGSSSSRRRSSSFGSSAPSLRNRGRKRKWGRSDGKSRNWNGIWTTPWRSPTGVSLTGQPPLNLINIKAALTFYFFPIRNSMTKFEVSNFNKPEKQSVYFLLSWDSNPKPHRTKAAFNILPLKHLSRESMLSKMTIKVVGVVLHWSKFDS